ncbi:helix-turn-helix domain-containing protein [Synechococcus sp. PCC 6312]|uniref:winged helix-turn-helix transcriptional regulator n=1 Tax=Synechococcus sp. (strain ATCC 27167 / PCC 6312) TaxID=195253 RepID=UPI00029ED2CB|nr:helix-turn-helix domain-containing protein [Synechococcus sp. PCC 6312]AFY60203.1 putative transcriptional regulator [Synechococcus sp. PCC 6312]
MELSVKTGSENSSNFTSDLIAMFEDCLGCKWTIHLLTQISLGINRPSALVKTQKGLTPKVLNECLTRLVQFGIVEKLTYPELPPRVEYYLTPFGQDFVEILDRIEVLQDKAKMARDHSTNHSKPL